MVRWLSRTAAAVVVATGFFAAPVVQASNGTDESALAGARNATAALHDVNAAVAAGYQRLLPCFDLPGVGGMGQHYVNTSRLHATGGAHQPEALVDEVNGDPPQLAPG